MQIYPSCLHILPKYIVQHNHLPTHLPLTLAHLSITIHVTTPQMQSRVIFKSFFCEYLTKGRHKPPLLSSITLVVRKLLPPWLLHRGGGSWRVPNHNFSQSAFAKYCLWANWKAQQYVCNPLSFLIFYFFCYNVFGFRGWLQKINPS